MSTYYLAKAHQEQVLREAAQARIVRAAKRAKRISGGQRSSQTKAWATCRLRATHA
jgi:hypothetical protein